MFIENENKLSLNLSDTNRDVKIKVSCSAGTIVSISFRDQDNTVQTVMCNDTGLIGQASRMKGKTVYFNGVIDNLIGEKSVTHEIYEEGGESVTYTFPDDFTGDADEAQTEGRVLYEFNCNLI